MAAKTDLSGQVKFLVCCIRNATSGKPDFNAVAAELGIVSKAAAQKRYERMLKAHNVNGSNPPASPAPGEETPKKTPAKKRGGAAAAADGVDETPTKKRARATKPNTPKAAKASKKESDDENLQKEENDEAESSLSEAVTEEMPTEETEAEA
ncbi:hypothetical protein ACRE_076580 [Hapsidospora chrysogenum ATCC 11550]|uniref:Myb-like DNA-binding domain-containing protein n=1 Tax=Hapsidospora chrysogenum (strain ATCC 11550 / CBS 779.69 / DSM 880 / IAM 14645 / JCM 23072 / IMI 49137) TaxID=857340 RepID=A0A086SWX2_HAPC1|nr:hypothetical protein ACRE_076580 [Hapsidospora chrysogenum ATCC 11550]